jgi:hypothetical protein
MVDRTHIEEWLRVHRFLMESEAAFSELAVQVADGLVSVEDLEEQRQVLMGLRGLCTAVYERAFPKSS